MKVEDFDFLATLLKERSGLVLTRDKAYLLETRLMPVARQRNLKGLEELVDSLRIDRDEELENLVTEAMTTNESLFFRDTKPFDQFRDLVLPKLMQNRAGMYTQFEVQRGLPITYLVKYFKQVGDKWQIDEKIRQMVTYKDFNLLKSPAPLGQFDVVFCRNVLIYFDQPTKAAVLQNVAQQMPQDGILYLGGAETVLGVTDKFQPIQGYRGMYMLSGGEPALVAAE